MFIKTFSDGSFRFNNSTHKIIANQVGVKLRVIKPFHVTGFFLYPLKRSENLWFSGGIERNQCHEMGWAVH